MIITVAGILLLVMLYLYKVKKARLEIIILKGLVLGVVKYEQQLDETKRHYVDFYLSFIAISFIYDS